MFYGKLIFFFHLFNFYADLTVAPRLNTKITITYVLYKGKMELFRQSANSFPRKRSIEIDWSRRTQAFFIVLHFVCFFCLFVCFLFFLFCFVFSFSCLCWTNWPAETSEKDKAQRPQETVFKPVVCLSNVIWPFSKVLVPF